MNKIMKFLGIGCLVAFLSLTVVNALTGHNIKGNPEINTEVLANGTTGTTGTGDDTILWEAEDDIENKEALGYFVENGKLCTLWQADITTICYESDQLPLCSGGTKFGSQWYTCS